MREIKFRVWNGEVMVNPDFINRGGIAYWKENSITEMSDEIMQYTGLKDKNDNEIYEGDIFKKGRARFIIEFRDGAFEMIGINIISVIRLSHSYRDIEIIGNIYENPELLGK